MPRPTKDRCICFLPQHTLFSAVPPTGRECILRTEELEALRLCDLIQLDQDNAAAQMGISRGTLQRILTSARATVAGALVNGNTLRIEGGTFRLRDACPGDCRCRQNCTCQNCGCPNAPNRSVPANPDGQEG